MNKAPLVDNVFTFIDKASSLHGQSWKSRFFHEMHSNCLELGMSSPIEHMFWVACSAICSANYVGVNPEPYFNHKGEEKLGNGIFIHPQSKLGKYTVDFLISQEGVGPQSHLGPIVVELDGHQFHDKDKRQRSYEKERDRFLVRSGYKVLHFTGSDVVADPFKVAHEALQMVGVFMGCETEDYNASNPLGGVL